VVLNGIFVDFLPIFLLLFELPSPPFTYYTIHSLAKICRESIQVMGSQQVLDQTGLVLWPLGSLHGSEESRGCPSDDL